MAIQFKVRKRTILNKGLKEAVYTPVPAGNGRTSTEEIIEQIEKRTSLTASDVYGVLMALGEVVGTHVKAGRTVEIEKFGYFRPRFKMKAEKKEEDVSERSVELKGIAFRPSLKFNERTRGAFFSVDNPMRRKVYGTCQAPSKEGDPKKPLDPNAGGTTNPKAGGGTTPGDEGTSF